MVRRDVAEARKERIGRIAQYIQAQLYQNKDSGEIPFSKTIAYLAVEIGLSKPRIIEYLELLEETSQFEIDAPADRIRKPRV